MGNFFSWIVAWVILLTIIVALLRFSWGKVIVYWLTWLLIVLLLVTHYQDIANLFQQANITAGEY